MVIELYKTTVQRRGREPLKSLISVSKHALKHLERGWGVLCYLECLLYFRGNLQTRLAAPSSVFRRLDKPSRPRCASMPGVRRFARKEAKGEINVKVGNEKSVFCLCWTFIRGFNCSGRHMGELLRLLVATEETDSSLSAPKPCRYLQHEVRLANPTMDSLFNKNS